ncbi:MAG: preprotein translocase subunit SecE [Bacteroidales bacterium]|nr:preprotein translocase subunit SecE [Bacteroidales bacterium]
MKKILAYIQDSYNELVHKVTWPSWKELQGSSILVMVSSIIIALVVALMDLIFKNFMSGVYNLFS